ncbi:hypothetical protein OKA04_08990 [Luteolibacter flavescens]|uniref:Uncharacterized protein n=1 Tax=Luteolibacter flavescens TaxID=1859460 RepID=A0ABT3FMR1_9BACT|nr:hypothetical protein [Luteolibacter flavescens]MCW1884862.1 hypothetical protein [Luteolibacter flavescens]
MKRTTANRFLFAGVALSLVSLLYCGSALRPFLISPILVIEANVPRDAFPLAGSVYMDYGMGKRLKFDLDAYVDMLKEPSRHKVRNVVVRYPMDDAVLVQDLNKDYEIMLLNLEDPPERLWRISSGGSLHATWFRGKLISLQNGGGESDTRSGDK